MSFAGSDISTSDFSQHGRFALAFAHLAVHTENRAEALDATAGSDAEDYVQKILDESANEWNEFIDYPFPYDLAKGATPLNGFRHYMIQDATHFEYFYRVRMEALGRTGLFQELKDFARILPGGLDAVQSGRTDCTTKLGVPKDIVDNEEVSPQLKEFIDFVASIANKGDYLDSIIALLPGVLGYNLITNKLVRDPDTVRNTVYYSLLILPWSSIPVKKHKDYINSHIASLSQEERDERWPGWVSHFKTGCLYEIDFSSLASPGQFPAYNIVPDGFYMIRSYRRGNPYLVSNLYPVSNPPFSVTTQDVPQGIWRLMNSPYGYRIENVPLQAFLTTSVTEPLKPVYDVSVSFEDYPWSINSVDVKGPEKSFKAYQLHVPGRLQYVLDAGSDSRVFVSNNAQISSQLWLLERVGA